MCGMFKPKKRRANDPTMSLVLRVIFGLVVEIESFSDYLAFSHVVFGAFIINPINRVLGKANRKCGVLGGHALYLHDSQILWSRPTSSENSVTSFAVIFVQIVIDVLIDLRDLLVESLDDASKPMWSSQAIRPLISDQNDVVAVVITAPPILLLRPMQLEDC